MNKNIMIASAIAAGAAALLLLLKKRRSVTEALEHTPAPRSRHLTGAFARAKPAAKQEDQSLGAGI